MIDLDGLWKTLKAHGEMTDGPEKDAFAEANGIELLRVENLDTGTIENSGTIKVPDALCRVCNDAPVFENGICRWESCEAEDNDYDPRQDDADPNGQEVT